MVSLVDPSDVASSGFPADPGATLKLSDTSDTGFFLCLCDLFPLKPGG